MLEPVEISEAARTTAEREVDRFFALESCGYHVQQLLNSETQKLTERVKDANEAMLRTENERLKLRNQVHECGALLQQRNKEIEELRERIAILEGRITQEDVFP